MLMSFNFTGIADEVEDALAFKARNVIIVDPRVTPYYSRILYLWYAHRGDYRNGKHQLDRLPSHSEFFTANNGSDSYPNTNPISPSRYVPGQPVPVLYCVVLQMLKHVQGASPPLLGDQDVATLVQRGRSTSQVATHASAMDGFTSAAFQPIGSKANLNYKFWRHHQGASWSWIAMCTDVIPLNMGIIVTGTLCLAINPSIQSFLKLSIQRPFCH